MTGTISDQIAEATEDIARRTVAEVGDIEQIKGMVQNGGFPDQGYRGQQYPHGRGIPTRPTPRYRQAVSW